MSLDVHNNTIMPTSTLRRRDNWRTRARSTSARARISQPFTAQEVGRHTHALVTWDSAVMSRHAARSYSTILSTERVY